ncbi:MAG: HAD hydrolase-like protein, partial [SAR324 cluster bacterium]|nr:HAD hydrolase-like protein [SAR324 cluster bacterium]
MPDNYTLLQRKYWIFDLDGTLTVAVHDFNAIRNELGIPAGQPILKTIESLPENESLALQQKLQEIEEKLARNARPAKGVKNLLEALHHRNYHLGILTLNSRENAWLTLEALDLVDYFNED